MPHLDQRTLCRRVIQPYQSNLNEWYLPLTVCRVFSNLILPRTKHHRENGPIEHKPIICSRAASNNSSLWCTTYRIEKFFYTRYDYLLTWPYTIRSHSIHIGTTNNRGI